MIRHDNKDIWIGEWVYRPDTQQIGRVKNILKIENEIHIRVELFLLKRELLPSLQRKVLDQEIVASGLLQDWKLDYEFNLITVHNENEFDSSSDFFLCRFKLASN